jgi:hypothetical protein
MSAQRSWITAGIKQATYIFPDEIASVKLTWNHASEAIEAEFHYEKRDVTGYISDVASMEQWNDLFTFLREVVDSEKEGREVVYARRS